MTLRIVLASLVAAGLALPAWAEAVNLNLPADFDAAAWQAEWDAHDTDGDGLLSREEAIAGNPNVAEVFDQIDTNGDGFISPDEDKAALAEALNRQ